MHISLNWIKDFVELPEMSPQDLATRFTLTTAEVEGVHVSGGGLGSVQIVEVLSKKPHPEADKLNLVTFTNGKESFEVVCGAPNVRDGMRVYFAPIGTTLPNGLTLEAKKIRGILSQGMLCSAPELGIGEESGGLFELPKDAPLGMKFLEHRGIKSDVLLEVDNKSLTHRPDLWGHFGLAREFAASLNKPLKNPFDEEWEKKILAKISKGAGPVTFDVESDSSCWAYLGLNIQGVKVGEAPEWMRSRLEAVGLRSINSIVDTSNYVMTELGMPNHIFDANTIEGKKLTIKKLKAPTKFKTLDGVERELTDVDTVISDAKEVSVLAGIMGGERSGVTEDTVDLFLEVANWDPTLVRKTSVRLGLRSDSSQRFEKTLDSHLCRRSLLRLVELILELNPQAKVTGDIQSWYNEQSLSKELTLKFPRSRITKVIGVDVEAARLEGFFKALDFKVKYDGSNFEVTVPTWRTTKDISCVDDLVEEVGRMIGYDNIIPKSPLLPVSPVRLSTRKVLQRKIQDFMTLQAQSLEIMTYPLVGAELLQKAKWPEMNEKLKLVNALSVEHDRMRPSLIPSALKMASENAKHFSDFSFFEFGRSYLDYENERSILLVGMYSRQNNRFLELLNTVEKLLNSLSLSFDFAEKNPKFKNTYLPEEWIGLHPHEFVNLRLQGKFLGGATSVHPILLKEFKVKGNLSVAVIDFTDFENREMKDKTKYNPISRFPSSIFDVSVVASSETPAGDVLKALATLKMKELKNISLVGVFDLPEEKKSVTLRAVFENPEATLTAEFLSSAEKQVVQVLEKSGFPLRS